jgi:hypothetical protein
MAESTPPSEQSQDKPSKRDPSKFASTVLLIIEIAITVVLLGIVVWKIGPLSRLLVETKSASPSMFVPLKEGSWRFVVSGDSRNCGDLVMPAIAAQAIEKYQPAFYWHLGDLRAIYKIDEDMAGAAHKRGQALSCESYHKNAWQDFIDHQIVPFGTTRFYLGIGNHEVIPPKSKAEFSVQFKDWLLTPRLQMQRQDMAEIAAAKTGPCGKIARQPYLSATPYYHWIRNQVDFIYLDNSSSVFSSDQLGWFDCVLDRAYGNNAVKAVVVGMHEALPASRASNHAMCDGSIQDPIVKKQSCESGRHVYDALVEFNKTKHVYLLASHSRFYMKGIFDDQPLATHLDGWIIGTAGAVRYPLPPGTQPGPDAITDHYGYLLGTVQNGDVRFEFQEVRESDVPQATRQQFPPALTSWCFAKNSQNQDPASEETTNRCYAPAAPLVSAKTRNK